jgi:hypothetical protein
MRSNPVCSELSCFSYSTYGNVYCLGCKNVRMKFVNVEFSAMSVKIKDVDLHQNVRYIQKPADSLL